MSKDTWEPPFSIKIMNNFLDHKYYNFLNDIINERTFIKATQGVKGDQVVQEQQGPPWYLEVGSCTTPSPPTPSLCHDAE